MNGTKTLLDCLTFFCAKSTFQWEKEGVTTLRLSIISTMLTLIFLVEVLMKVIAFTLRGYWQSRRNRYDLFVSLMGVAWVSFWHLLGGKNVSTLLTLVLLYSIPLTVPFCC